METILVHEDIAAELLPVMGKELLERNVEIRGDETVNKYIPESKKLLKKTGLQNMKTTF